jgi:hypothetical protein
MFEIGIFCVILLATGYWVALWLMGRHDDVLHGDFIQSDEQAEVAPPALPPTLLTPKSLPRVRPNSPESLQSLLAAITRDLKDATQIY